VNFEELSRTEAFEKLRELLSGTGVPDIRISKPRWIIKHLKVDTERYDEIKSLCEHIVHKGWT
jgi:hypothetical protein